MNVVTNIITKIKLYFIKQFRLIYKYFDIYSVAISFVTMYLCNNFMLFIGLISIDSAYAAMDFIKSNTDKTLTDSQVLETNGKIYDIGTMERYIFYMLISTVYGGISYLVLDYDMIICKHLIGLLIVPKFFNAQMTYYCSDIFSKITVEKNELVTKICFEQIANAIIYLEKVYIGRRKAIDKLEIINALYNIDAVKTDAYLFVKNVIITSVLIYLRKNSKVYYKIAKHAYSYGYGMYIQEMTLDKAKLLFDNIIVNKQYGELQNPMVIQAIIYLYYDKEETDEFNFYIKKLKYRIVTMLSLWTIASFFSGFLCCIVINILSMVLMIFRKYPLRKKIILSYLIEITKDKTTIDLNAYKLFANIDDRAVISIITTTIIGYFTDSAMILSIINQFSGILLFNYTIYNLLKIIYINGKIGSFLKNTHCDKQSIINYFVVSLACAIYWKIYGKILYYCVLILPFLTNSSYAKYIFGIHYVGIINNSHNMLILIILGYILSLINNYTKVTNIITIQTTIAKQQLNKETQTNKLHVCTKEIQTSKKIKKDEEKIKDSKNSSFTSDYLAPTAKFKKF